MNQQDPIVITGMASTPIGAFQGVLKDASCAQLGATVICSALERSELEP